MASAILIVGVIIFCVVMVKIFNWMDSIPSSGYKWWKKEK